MAKMLAVARIQRVRKWGNAEVGMKCPAAGVVAGTSAA